MLIPFCTVGLLVSWIISSATATSSTCADPSALVPFLRAFNGKDHFYTTNVSEMLNLVAIAQDDYSFEGTSGWIWTTQQPGTIPLYRLYNDKEDDHFYTMSPDEVPEMMHLGWTYDTAPNHIAGYIYPYSVCGASPIYRLFNPTIVDHFYTMDPDEAARSGYQDQGIAGYAALPSANGTIEGTAASNVPYLLPTAISASPQAQVSTALCANTADATPLLRAYSSISSDHFYTTNSTEMNVAMAEDSYSFEGDAGFLWTSQVGATVQLYRMWSSGANDHFYTVDWNETQTALKLGYTFDTSSHIAGWVYPYEVCGASPIYRLYSSSANDHFYTMSYTEGQSAAGYVIEGVAGFALLPSTDGSAQTVTVSASPLFLAADTASAVSMLQTPSQIPVSTTSFSAAEFPSVLPGYSSTSISNEAIAQMPIPCYGVLSAAIAAWAGSMLRIFN